MPPLRRPRALPHCFPPAAAFTLFHSRGALRRFLHLFAQFRKSCAPPRHALLALTGPPAPAARPLEHAIVPYAAGQKRPSSVRAAEPSPPKKKGPVRSPPDQADAAARSAADDARARAKADAAAAKEMRRAETEVAKEAQLRAREESRRAKANQKAARAEEKAARQEEALHEKARMAFERARRVTAGGTLAEAAEVEYRFLCVDLRRPRATVWLTQDEAVLRAWGWDSWSLADRRVRIVSIDGESFDALPVAPGRFAVQGVPLGLIAAVDVSERALRTAEASARRDWLRQVAGEAVREQREQSTLAASTALVRQELPADLADWEEARDVWRTALNMRRRPGSSADQWCHGWRLLMIPRPVPGRGDMYVRAPDMCPEEMKPPRPIHEGSIRSLKGLIKKLQERRAAAPCLPVAATVYFAPSMGRVRCVVPTFSSPPAAPVVLTVAPTDACQARTQPQVLAARRWCCTKRGVGAARQQ
jgi:hypothetical protein